ncbi:dihydrodipicolinate synthase [Ligilactobacillus hayakitensis DSM 18933 = JCM 14209]|uniref:4-hydroxy-tetrahydrodipicolinate synthase n=1 Tax=Ligilactobacillus hayakitensis DSM 18933 = JCM 14209 TaxID=1423755 RepID=A0A0R1WNN3_9LACO|nr:4-hydroxy-tetrahydrodipicolinate synthase [Ligilactobacillus hayakitensis]KRM19045.1 dihydrodipicolinate synthase [Ligilactobacillus hayakitensis DSM 18933 = JCM 14209]
MDFSESKIVTAMVTPFDEDGNYSKVRLKTLIEHLINSGSEGLLVSGTTGEAPTLTHDEKIDLIKDAVEFVDGRIPVMVGTGSNNTKQTIEYTNEVAQIKGVDAALVVVPYYNKPDQNGMLAHFRTVADNVNLPIFIYNIPGRTGVEMNVETVIELSKHDNIVGIKDCTGIENIAKLVENTGDDFLVYSGEDAQALAAKVVGAQGIISVASHLFGNDISTMYQLLKDGDIKKAGQVMRTLTPKVDTLFSKPSPSPVKAGLNDLGIKVGGCRLPIVTLNGNEYSEIIKKLEM